MSLNMTYFDAALKEMYSEEAVRDLTYQDQPFLAMVPKKEDWSGDAFVIPVKYGNSAGGVSNTISTAITNKGYGRSAKFTLTHTRDYGIGSIDNLTIEASQSNEGAFIDALTFEMESVAGAFSQSLGAALFGNGGGAIGQIASVTSSAITLKNPEDIVKFEVGMVLAADTTDGTSGTVHTGTITVTDVDRDTGVITGSTTGIGSIAADDYLFKAGDFGNKLTGLAGWIPMSAPSATAFFGLDRTSDATRLAGVRISAASVAGLPIEEKLLFGLTRLAREGARPDTIFVSYETFRDLEISMQSRVMYQSLSVGQAFFNALVIAGPKGNVKVMADQNCPSDRAYILTMDSWKLISTGAFPHTLDRDGIFSRESTSDGYEFRLGAYGNLGCYAPGHNCVIDLS